MSHLARLASPLTATLSLLLPPSPLPVPLSVAAAHATRAHAKLVAVAVNDDLSKMYRQRWSGVKDSGSGVSPLSLYSSAAADAEEAAQESDELCIITKAEQSICGTPSFDSSESGDGPVCVEVATDGVAKWMCN